VRWAPAPRRVLSARRRHGARASPQHTSTSVSQRRGERRSCTPLPAEETVLDQTLRPCSQLIEGERRRWAPFTRALPKADQAVFERLFGCAKFPIQAGVIVRARGRLRPLSWRCCWSRRSGLSSSGNGRAVSKHVEAVDVHTSGVYDRGIKGGATTFRRLAGRTHENS
jgi:hypothetical protein